MGCSGSSSSSASKNSKKGSLDPAANKSKNLLIGYWSYPGLGQPIRYLLELTETPYDERVYSKLNQGEWYSIDKHALQLTYPNLPYLIHGNIRISETQNIMAYLTSTPSLIKSGDDYSGRSLKVQYEVRNIETVCLRIIQSIFSVATTYHPDKQVLNFAQQSQPRIEQLLALLANKTQFYKKITTADIYFYTAMRLVRMHLPELYSLHFEAKINPFLQAFEAIPRIKAYHSSEKFLAIDSSFTTINTLPITLGYWNYTGLIQPTRYVLELAGVQYDSVIYKQNSLDSNGISASQISQEKKQENNDNQKNSELKAWDEAEWQRLGVEEHAGLPYLACAELIITGPINLVDYAIRSTNQLKLYGKAYDKYKIRQLWIVCCGLLDKINHSRQLQGKNQMNFILLQILPLIQQLSNCLNKQSYLFGNSLTIADISLYHAITYFWRIYPNEVGFQAEFQNLTNSFEAIPNIHNYHNSDRYKQLIF